MGERETLSLSSIRSHAREQDGVVIQKKRERNRREISKEERTRERREGVRW